MEQKLLYFTFCKSNVAIIMKTKSKQWSKTTNLEAVTSIMSEVSLCLVL